MNCPKMLGHFPVKRGIIRRTVGQVAEHNKAPAYVDLHSNNRIPIRSPRRRAQVPSPAPRGQAPSISMRTRCCAPVTGLRIGSPRPSVTPDTTRRALRAAMSSWNSIGAKIGSCTFSKVDANTLKTVAARSRLRSLRTKSASMYSSFRPFASQGHLVGAVA
jgi:hypothetical protein